MSKQLLEKIKKAFEDARVGPFRWWINLNNLEQELLKILEDHRELGKYINDLFTEMTAKIESDLKLHGISQNNELVIMDKKQGKFVVVEKQKLLARLLKLTKPRAGSIYSRQQEEGMMLLLTELLVEVKPHSRDHVEGMLHNLNYGFTAKGPRSKTIKKLMELKEKKFVELGLDTKKEILE